MGLLLWLHQKYMLLRMETTQAIHTLLLAPQSWKRGMAQTRSLAWILLFLPQSFQREPWLSINIYLCLGPLAIFLSADFLSHRSSSPWQNATLQKEFNFWDSLTFTEVTWNIGWLQHGSEEQLWVFLPDYGRSGATMPQGQFEDFPLDLNMDFLVDYIFSACKWIPVYLEALLMLRQHHVIKLCTSKLFLSMLRNKRVQ